MKKLRISAAILVLSLAFTVGLGLYEVPEVSWERNILDNDTQARSVQMGSTGRQVHIVYQKSSGQGVRHLSTELSDGFLTILQDPVSERNWESRKVDQDSGTGSYMSMSDSNDSLKIAYQDSTVGSEEVVYASYSDGNWTREVVDTASESGFNVGMYTSVTSFDGRPLVAYHSPQNGLEVAVKRADGWDETVISDDTGWFTSSTTCGEKVFLAYTGRNSRAMNISSYNGENWKTEKTGRRAVHDTALVNDDCEPALAYMDASTGTLNFMKENVSTIMDTRFPKIGLLKEESYHIAFRKYGEGVYYGNSTDGEDWNLTKVGADFNSGKYADLTVDEPGNIHLAYSNKTTLVHAELNRGRVSKVETALKKLRSASNVSNLLFFIIFLFFAWREDFFSKMKNHMVHEEVPSEVDEEQESDEDSEDEEENQGS